MIFINFSVIFNLFIVLPLLGSHIITTFEGERLVKYFILLLNKTSDELSNIQESFSERNLSQFCHELRKSRIFQIKGKETWVRESSKIGHEINKDLLDREHNLTETIGIKKKLVLGVGNTNITNLSSFNCMDHYGDFNWFVTTGFVEGSDFLFNLRPNFFHLFLRETHGQMKKMEIIPRLIAIIDESAELVPEHSYRGTFDDILYNSIEISAEKFHEEEKLCKIPPILQFRLCSVVADVLLADQLNRTESHTAPNSSQIYQIRTSNYYSQFRNPQHHCPYMNLHYNSRMFRRHQFLICDLILEDSAQFFFLSLNLLNNNEAFVGQLMNPEPGDSNEGIRLFRAPLLLHLDKYIEILDDENI